MADSSPHGWLHAVETAVLVGAGGLAAAATLPAAGVPAWVLPTAEVVAGFAVAAPVAHARRVTLARYSASMGVFLGAWTAWAEITRLWSLPVISGWIIGMIVFAPAAAVAARSRASEDSLLEAGEARRAALTGGAWFTPDDDEDKEDDEDADSGLPGVSEQQAAEDAPEMRRFETMFANAGCKEVRVLSLSEERAGRMLRLELPRSGQVTLASLKGIAPNIEVILRLREGCAEFETGAHSGEVIMRLRERDVFGANQGIGPEHRAVTINDPFAIGIQEDGSILKVRYRELHMMIIGATGMGKSNLLNVILSQLCNMVDTVVWVIDMKGGRTARPWLQAYAEGRARYPALDWVATTREEAALMMDAFEGAIAARMNSGVGGSKITPSASMPQIVLVCDEMAVLFSSDRGGRLEVGEGAMTNQQFLRKAEGAVQLGRSEAASTLWATQRGTNSMAGSGDLKAGCRMRIALGAATEAELRYSVPDARISSKQLAYMATNPGVGVVTVTSNTSGLVKFFWCDHIEGECSEGANVGCVAACPVYQSSLLVGGLRPRLDQLTARPLGEAYSRRWERSSTLLDQAAGRGMATMLADGDPAKFEEVLRGGGMQDPEKVHPARRRYREILSARGTLGATPKVLLERLQEEGLDIARETLSRWLSADQAAGLVHNPDYARWKYGPGPDGS